MQARHVEPGQPHVAHEHDLQRVTGILKSFRQCFPARLVPSVPGNLRPVIGATGHDHLDDAFLVVLVVPVGAQLHQLIIKLHTDATAHTDNHRLAVHHLQPRLPMLHQILGDQPQPLVRAHDLLQRRPLRLEVFLLGQFLAFRRLLEIKIDLRLLVRLEFQLGEPAFVINRHGRLVFHRAQNVVDADVIAEHRPRVRVGLLDRRAGEPDPRRIRQPIPHILGESVNRLALLVDLRGKPVLTPVRFVRDNDDVVTLGQAAEVFLAFIGKEFLRRRENHAAAGNLQELAQVVPVFGLDRRLPQQFLTPRERPEQLIVQIVPVGDDHDGRVLHRSMRHQPARIERHRQRLAGPLRVPDHADAPVTRRAARLMLREITATGFFDELGALTGGSDGFLHRNPDRVKLMIPGHLFDDRARAVILEHDEIPHEIEKPPLLKHPAQQYL